MRKFPRVTAVALSLIALIPASAPVLAFMLVHRIAEPEGFWQELALGVVGGYVLGGFQILFAIIWMAWTIFWSFWAFKVVREGALSDPHS